MDGTKLKLYTIIEYYVPLDLDISFNASLKPPINLN